MQQPNSANNKKPTSGRILSGYSKSGSRWEANLEDVRRFCVVTDVIQDIILDVRYYSGYNFVGRRIEGYEQPLILLTKEATQILRNVAAQLKPKGYLLKLFDGYRPQMAVDQFMTWAKDPTDTLMKRYFYPEIEKERIVPEHYLAAKSGHSRGSTIDLTLFDIHTGKEVDMGGSYDYFGQLSHPDYPVGGKPGMKPITQQQYENRRLLRRVMVENGFEPLESEWWHFTLKNEPFTNTYFNFPINESIIRKAQNQNPDNNKDSGIS